MAVSLSIGTSGFFWWYTPSQGYFYTSRINNLENNTMLKFKPPHGLKVEWERQAVKAEHVIPIKLAMSYLVRIKGQKEEVALDSYLTGLSLFGKCDCHIDFFANAFESFFRAFRTAMTINGEIHGGETLYDAAVRHLGEVIVDLTELRKYLELGERIEATKTGVPSLRLNDVASMKSICDAYFLLRAAIVVRDSVYKTP